jgi:hypothetical protein
LARKARLINSLTGEVMAQYQHLPIYRITYELLQKSVLTIKEFPRDYKFTIGQQLQETIVGLVVLIYKANTAKAERLIYIEQLLEKIQVTELLIRLSQDMRLISKKDYGALVEMTQSLNKQAEGWRKSASKLASNKSSC